MRNDEQALVERLALVDRVVLLGQLARWLEELQPDEPQALALEAGHHLADQPALNRVRLEKDQCLLHGPDLARDVKLGYPCHGAKEGGHRPPPGTFGRVRGMV